MVDRDNPSLSGEDPTEEVSATSHASFLIFKASNMSAHKHQGFTPRFLNSYKDQVCF